MPRCGCGRAPISPTVIADRVKVLAEFRPNVVPDGGIKNSVMNQHRGLRGCPTLLVVDFRSVDLKERTWTCLRGSHALRPSRATPQPSEEDYGTYKDSARGLHCQLGLAAAASPAPRCLVKNSTIVTVDLIRFGVLRKPCPSSGKSTYSTGTPRSFRLLTICSASITGTLVSFAPC